MPNRTVSPVLRVVGFVLLVLCVSSACGGSGDSASDADGTPSAGPTVQGVEVGAPTVTVVAAGDIARRPDDAVGTAALIKSIEPDAVLALGDTAYDRGSREEYREKYDPTWGAFKKITRPIPGSHEYKTSGAQGYFDYFRNQIHDRPYYAWDAGSWRMYALNCDIDCGRGSEQIEWLLKDLSSHDKPSLAYVHEPLYTCSTRHPPARRLDDLWVALQESRGQLVLSGNIHAYERFAPLDAKGDTADDGLRQFVVGTGGAALYPLVSPCEHREAESDTTEGVLKLELDAQSYSWEFIAVDGSVLDSGSQAVR